MIYGQRNRLQSIWKNPNHIYRWFSAAYSRLNYTTNTPVPLTVNPCVSLADGMTNRCFRCFCLIPAGLTHFLMIDAALNLKHFYPTQVNLTLPLHDQSLYFWATDYKGFRRIPFSFIFAFATYLLPQTFFATNFCYSQSINW